MDRRSRAVGEGGREGEWKQGKGGKGVRIEESLEGEGKVEKGGGREDLEEIVEGIGKWEGGK